MGKSSFGTSTKTTQAAVDAGQDAKITTIEQTSVTKGQLDPADNTKFQLLDKDGNVESTVDLSHLMTGDGEPLFTTDTAAAPFVPTTEGKAGDAYIVQRDDGSRRSYKNTAGTWALAITYIPGAPTVYNVGRDNDLWPLVSGGTLRAGDVVNVLNSSGVIVGESDWDGFKLRARRGYINPIFHRASVSISAGAYVTIVDDGALTAGWYICDEAHIAAAVPDYAKFTRLQDAVTAPEAMKMYNAADRHMNVETLGIGFGSAASIGNVSGGLSFDLNINAPAYFIDEKTGISMAPGEALMIAPNGVYELRRRIVSGVEAYNFILLNSETVFPILQNVTELSDETIALQDIQDNDGFKFAELDKSDPDPDKWVEKIWTIDPAEVSADHTFGAAWDAAERARTGDVGNAIYVDTVVDVAAVGEPEIIEFRFYENLWQWLNLDPMPFKNGDRLHRIQPANASRPYEQATYVGGPDQIIVSESGNFNPDAVHRNGINWAANSIRTLRDDVNDRSSKVGWYMANETFVPGIPMDYTKVTRLRDAVLHRGDELIKLSGGVISDIFVTDFPVMIGSTFRIHNTSTTSSFDLHIPNYARFETYDGVGLSYGAPLTIPPNGIMELYADQGGDFPYRLVNPAQVLPGIPAYAAGREITQENIDTGDNLFTVLDDTDPDNPTELIYSVLEPVTLPAAFDAEEKQIDGTSDLYAPAAAPIAPPTTPVTSIRDALTATDDRPGGELAIRTELDEKIDIPAGQVVGAFLRRQPDGSYADELITINSSNTVSGFGAPANNVGDVGFFYQQLDAPKGENDIWGPKTNGGGGGWPAQADAKSADPEEMTASDLVPGAATENTPKTPTGKVLNDWLAAQPQVAFKANGETAEVGKNNVTTDGSSLALPTAVANSAFSISTLNVAGDKIATVSYFVSNQAGNAWITKSDPAFDIVDASQNMPTIAGGATTIALPTIAGKVLKSFSVLITDTNANLVPPHFNDVGSLYFYEVHHNPGSNSLNFTGMGGGFLTGAAARIILWFGA